MLKKIKTYLKKLKDKYKIFHKKANDYLKRLQKKIKPWIKKAEPFYKKLKPYQDKAVAFFFQKTGKYLIVKSEQKEKIASGKIILYSRLAVLGAIIFQMLISGALVGSTHLILSSLVFYLPLAYLVFRGYRIASLLLILIRTVDSISILIASPAHLINVILWWVILCAVYFNAFRLENARVQMQKSGELSKKRATTLRDSLIAFLLFAVALFSVGFANMMSNKTDAEAETQANVELGMVSTFVIHNQRGYSDFCEKRGYIMTNYPQAFSQKFADEIKSIDEKLADQNMSLQKVYQQLKQTHWHKLEKVVETSLEIIRRQAIIANAGKDQNIPLSEVKYTPDLDKTLSIEDACEIFDNAADEVLAQPNPQFEIIRQYH